jgi:hypothetical protein
MAIDPVIVPDSRSEFGRQFKFHEVFRAEIAVINGRRALASRQQIDLEIEAGEDATGEPVLTPAENANVVGAAGSARPHSASERFRRWRRRVSFNAWTTCQRCLVAVI